MRASFVALALLAVTHAARCPSGKTMVQKKGVPVVSNGCTGADLIQVDEDFTFCCDEHDACFGSCQVPRKRCDDAFKKCMLHMCDTVYGGKQSCKSAADMFHMGTNLLGQGFYDQTQAEVCTCVDTDDVEAHYHDLVTEFYAEHAPESWPKFDFGRYEAYGSNSKKWGGLLWRLYKKYPEAMVHDAVRVAKGDVPRPPAKGAKKPSRAEL